MAIQPEWIFTRAANGTWAWRVVPQDGGAGVTANSFISLGECTAAATKLGFDPFTQYWIANADGRATHYRPGHDPVNTRDDEELKD